VQLRDGQLTLSPSDLSGHLACAHLTTLSLAVARGERARPFIDDPHRDLIFRKGNEHEAAYLTRLEAEGRTMVRIPTYDDEGFDADEARRLTEEAVREGTADVVYQAFLTDGTWRGFADFLERTADGGYEPVDTKLSRSAKPGHVLQLCFYAEQLERITARMPEHMHVELGTGMRETLRTADFMAYYRQVRGRFLQAVDGRAGPVDTYPWPCHHCGICDFRRICRTQLEEDDNLVLVAGLGRGPAQRLVGAGIPTLAALGGTAPDAVAERMRPEAFERLRHQAELQLYRRTTREHRVDDLPLEAERGYQRLPAPDVGDVWLDLEGHPFYEPARGLEYLFGWCYRDDDGSVRYRALWAKDRESERGIFEEFVDWVVERRRRYPGLHVYHYAQYERTALRRLMGEHGTREHEIDTFLREEVLVDLYRVVREAFRASVNSYSIKVVEELYAFERTAEVSGGDESTVLFEQWLESGDDAILRDVEAYNEEDCRSTVALHEWLLERRPPGLSWLLPPDQRVRSEEAEERDAERAALQEALLAAARLGADGGGEAEASPLWLTAQLLDYHQREAKPQWWEWFFHLELSDDELVEDGDTIGGLRLAGEPQLDKGSLVYPFSFPPQEHKIDHEAVDPRTQKSYAVTVDDERGVVRLWRSKGRADEPLPTGLIPPAPIGDYEQRDAVARFARAYLARSAGPDVSGPYEALRHVLERRLPRARLDATPVAAALSLDRSYLFVQGPPGSGKTWQGAKIAVALMRAGQRVGVTSLSHKAINKLLAEVEREAREQGFRFRGVKKHTHADDAFSGDFVEPHAVWKDCLDPGYQLVAGTSWLLAREEFDSTLDALIVDEAGQVSLADAIASGTCARNIVLLGDPNQLPQVSQGAQPEEARVSVLQHLLGADETVPPERGIFLDQTRRLRPELCAFTSEAYYEGRLVPWPETARRTIAAEDGLDLLLVEHAGRSQQSREEAAAVAAEIRRLLGTLYTDERGLARPLTAADVLVVAPYNAQVRALRQAVPAGVRVGTVDKFQGQEAPVVIVSFASSSGEEAPRGIRFAFDRHRVNVATSRGQCRVVLVLAPRLLEADCKTVDDMRLVNAVCRFVELAEERR
jgi:uncharacterized protein